jgi:hypothetical protein
VAGTSPAVGGITNDGGKIPTVLDDNFAGDRLADYGSVYKSGDLVNKQSGITRSSTGKGGENEGIRFRTVLEYLQLDDTRHRLTDFIRCADYLKSCSDQNLSSIVVQRSG